MKFWIKQFFSDSTAHRKAAEEVFFVCVLSLIPLILLAMIDQVRMSSSLEVSALFWDAINDGQLYLYSFSLFGMLFWLCQKEHENFARFEPRRYFMLVALVPTFFIIVVYALEPTMTRPLRTSLINASYLVYLLYVLVYYALLVFDHLEPPEIESHLEEQTDVLMEEYKGLEGEDGRG